MLTLALWRAFEDNSHNVKMTAENSIQSFYFNGGAIGYY